MIIVVISSSVLIVPRDTFIRILLGLYSLSGKMSCRKISWSIEAAGLDVIMIALKFDRHLGNAAAEVPVKFQSDCKILNPNLVASRLNKILR